MSQIILPAGVRANSEKAPVAEPTAVTAGQPVAPWHGLRGEYITRVRRVNTYSANYRLATVAGRNDLNFAFTANTDKQVATLHHAASATKLVRIHRVAVVMMANTVAGVLAIDLRRITSAPATGNPAITPMPHNSTNPATECTALALPTTGGTDVTPDRSYSITTLNLAAFAATASVGANQGMVELLNQGDLGDSAQSIELQPGTLEGVAVWMRHTAASTNNFYVRIVYTEETP